MLGLTRFIGIHFFLLNPNLIILKLKAQYVREEQLFCKLGPNKKEEKEKKKKNLTMDSDPKMLVRRENL